MNNLEKIIRSIGKMTMFESEDIEGIIDDLKACLPEFELGTLVAQEKMKYRLNMFVPAIQENTEFITKFNTCLGKINGVKS